jgi:phosphonate transport system ATP-binding protein
MSAVPSTMAGGMRVVALTKRYRAATVLDQVSFEVATGEVVAVLGPSGAGKTTLFRCVTRLVPPDAGQIFVCGHALHLAQGHQLCAARREIGLIFQQFNLIRRVTALDNVLAGRLGHAPTWRVLLRRFSQGDRQVALAALDQVGLLAFAYHRADHLSGGQQQRVAIARVLAQQSRLILADEPVASLDPESAIGVLGLLRDIAHERRIAVVCSLHQVEFARAFADRVIGLRDGRIVADLPVSHLSAAVQARIYGA